jgi:RNA polymerase sigma-70 factor (ECF subfamily)
MAEWTAMSDAYPMQQIWAEFGHQLRGFITRRVDNVADADDILQDVFLRIHQHRDSVQRADRLGAWLFQVTRNAIADHYRAPERRREVVAGASADLELVATDLTDGAHEEEAERDAEQANRELANCLRPIIERLPEIYREAVVLADLEGITQREVADRLGLSVSGAKSRVQRGRQAIKGMLQDCCRIQVDAGGRITGYEVQTSSCRSSTGHCQEAAVDSVGCGVPADLPLERGATM